jgi:hypothetical protein
LIGAEQIQMVIASHKKWPLASDGSFVLSFHQASNMISWWAFVS